MLAERNDTASLELHLLSVTIAGMEQRSRTLRRARIKRMNAILRALYPRATITLQYSKPHELLIAVILSAQCTDERVNAVTETLFKRYQTVRDYAHAPQRELERAIFSCGFYRSKARHIRGAARAILARHEGKIPTTLTELIALPGVGRKTANVVLSILFETHEGIAVDTHVRRFAIRFDLSDYHDPKRIEQDLMELMPRKDWWGFNHRLVQYGRDYCGARRHDCMHHPLTTVYPRAARIWPRAQERVK